VYMLACTFSSRRAARVVALLYAMHPALACTAAVTRPDTLAACLTCVLCLLHSGETRSWLRTALAGVVAGLLLLCSSGWLVTVPLLALVSLLAGRVRLAAWGAAGLFLTTAGLVALPWALMHTVELPAFSSGLGRWVPDGSFLLGDRVPSLTQCLIDRSFSAALLRAALLALGLAPLVLAVMSLTALGRRSLQLWPLWVVFLSGAALGGGLELQAVLLALAAGWIDFLRGVPGPASAARLGRRAFLQGLGAGTVTVVAAVCLVGGRNGWWVRRALLRLRLLRPPVNLLRNAAFLRCTTPGIPDYWATPGGFFLRLGDDGPLPGVRSLRLERPDAGWNVYLESFNAAYDIRLPAQRSLTFSVYLRGVEGRTAVVLGLNWGQRVVEVDEDWRRHVITLEAANPVEAVQDRLLVSVSLAGPGPVLVAAPQLESGRDATAFGPALIDDYPTPEVPWPADVDLPVAGEADPLTARVELSSYAPEARARVLVRSRLAEAGKLTITLAGGRVLADELPLEENSRFWVELNLAGLPAGSHRMEFRATTTQGRRLAEAADTIVGVRDLPSVQIDRIKRHLVVRGKPFPTFGIGLGHTPAGLDLALEEVALQGLNTVAFFAPGQEDHAARLRRVRQQLDAAARQGLLAVPFLGIDTGTPFPEIIRQTQELLAASRSHTALLAWILIDEPTDWWTPERVRELYAVAKEVDPGHPIFLNENRWESSAGGRSRLSRSDLGSVDCYPAGHFRNGPVRIAELARPAGADCRRAGKPFAYWLQLYGGNWDAPREPTPAELKAMTYLALVHDARLFFFWLYKPTSPQLWGALPGLFAEVRRWLAAVSVDAAELVHLGVAGGGRLHYAVWRVGPRQLVLVSNACAARVAGKLKVSGRRVSPWYGGGTQHFFEGGIVVTLGSYQRQVLELE
jgi:hypothetical protein